MSLPTLKWRLYHSDFNVFVAAERCRSAALACRTSGWSARHIIETVCKLAEDSFWLFLFSPTCLSVRAYRCWWSGLKSRSLRMGLPSLTTTFSYCRAGCMTELTRICNTRRQLVKASVRCIGTAGRYSALWNGNSWILRGMKKKHEGCNYATHPMALLEIIALAAAATALISSVLFIFLISPPPSAHPSADSSSAARRTTDFPTVQTSRLFPWRDFFWFYHG